MPAKFEASALFELLGRVDRELAAPSTIFLIGGSAVLVPERHDLAIMKLARGYEHDLQALEDIHRLHPFEVETLVARYEATEVVGPRRRFALALMDLIARLFGDDEATKRRPLLDKLAW
jgi:hypothetical protein